MASVMYIMKFMMIVVIVLMGIFCLGLVKFFDIVIFVVKLVIVGKKMVKIVFIGIVLLISVFGIVVLAGLLFIKIIIREVKIVVRIKNCVLIVIEVLMKVSIIRRNRNKFLVFCILLILVFSFRKVLKFLVKFIRYSVMFKVVFMNKVRFIVLLIGSLRLCDKM